jgi:hypothetical protein
LRYDNTGITPSRTADALSSDPITRPQSIARRDVAFLVTLREVLQAAFLCALVAALFLGGALFTGKYLSPANLLSGYYPWSGQQALGSSAPTNGLLGDDATQFEPWLQYSAERLHEGQFPLWDPDNMLGAPFMANMQSGLFYPLNWLYFLFPGALSLALRAWLKIFLALLGMYLLARRVAGLGRLGAAVSSISFGLGAFMTVWLLFPQTAVAVWLPWLWWATANLIERQTARNLAIVAAIVSLIIVAGHPETAYELALATGLFALFWLWRLRSWGWRPTICGLGLWLGACLLGVCLAAVQLIPFAEYAMNSATGLYRADVRYDGFWLPFYYAWTSLSPDLYGNPAHASWWGPQSNYNEANMYCGLLVVLLSLFSPLAPQRAQRHLALFLLFLIVTSMVVVFNAPVLRQFLVTATFSSDMATQRMTLVAEFALALLGGLGVQGFQAWLQRRQGRFTIALYTGMASLLLLIVGVVIPWALAHSFFEVPSSQIETQIWQAALVRSLVLLAVCCGLLWLIVWFYCRRPVIGRALLACLPLLLLADLLQAHADYTPTVSQSAHYPSTTATTFLQEQQAQQGLFRTAATNWTFTPNTNLMYGLSDVRGYDALEPLPYHDLMLAADSSIRQTAEGGFRPIHTVASHLLDALNVRYIVTSPGENPNFAQDASQLGGNSDLLTGPLGGPHTVGQTFIARQDNLTQIQVFGSFGPARPAGQLVFHLKSSPSDPSDLVTQQLDLSSLQDATWWSITFSPVRQAKGRSFYFYFSAPDATTTDWIHLKYSPGNPYGGGELMKDGKPASGDLLFSAFAFRDLNSPRFEQVLDGGPQGAGVFENVRALPRAWLVHKVEVQTDPTKRLGRLADATFDLAGSAMLSTPLPAMFALPADTTASHDDHVTIISYQPETVQIATQSAAAGLLILDDEQFPGWEVSVDDRTEPILTVDNALRGVYLPSGAHTVEFVYKPFTSQVGALVSIAGLVLVILLWWGFPRIRFSLQSLAVSWSTIAAKIKKGLIGRAL